MFSDRDEDFMHVFFELAVKWRDERPEEAREGLRAMAVTMISISLAEPGNLSTSLVDHGRLETVVRKTLEKANEKNLAASMQYLEQQIPSSDEPASE